MLKHTPGPWSVGYTRKSSCSEFAHFETPVHVGEVNRGNALAIVHLGGDGAINGSREAVEANARLIAAAPEMLAELRKVEEWLGDFCDQGILDKHPAYKLWLSVQAAIEKAGAQ